MKKNQPHFKLISLLLIVIMALPLFSSCAQNKTVVGTVNGQPVYYDELYFLVSNYKGSVEEKTGADTDLMRQELDRLVRENIVKNYAIIALCEKYGLKYSDIESEIDDELELYIAENFNGEKSEFRKSCKEFGLSERYVRYTLGLDLLYEQLPSKYVQNGDVYTSDDEILSYIKENFIRVNHLVLFNDSEDERQANADKMAEAKQLLDDGEKLETLIGRGYSEDFNPSSNGYYITKGTMVEEYETAAFSLKKGEHSDIISAYSENNNGEYVSCFYIIKRFEMSDEYINNNFTSLKNDYYNSVINSDLDEIEKTLSFEPNKKYEKLDLAKLSRTTNITAVIIVSVIACVVVATIIIIIVIKNKHKKKNVSYKNKPVRR